MLFPQDVPKIIFIDADQAGHFFDRFFCDSSDVFFLGGALGGVIGLRVVKYLIIFGRHTY